MDCRTVLSACFSPVNCATCRVPKACAAALGNAETFWSGTDADVPPFVVASETAGETPQETW
jgi:hypothetical protein